MFFPNEAADRADFLRSHVLSVVYASVFRGEVQVEDKWFCIPLGVKLGRQERLSLMENTQRVPHRPDYPHAVPGAVLSAKIEGTQATLECGVCFSSASAHHQSVRDADCARFDGGSEVAWGVFTRMNDSCGLDHPNAHNQLFQECSLATRLNPLIRFIFIHERGPEQKIPDPHRSANPGFGNQVGRSQSLLTARL